jgi:hypothetical protein
MASPNTFTANGAPAFDTSQNALLDLFMLGTGRHSPADEASSLMTAAWAADPLATLAIVLQTRCCRARPCGKGERQTSYTLMKWIKCHHPDVYAAILPRFVQLGCHRDYVELADPADEKSIELEQMAADLKMDFSKLSQGNHAISLAAKWAPSERSGSYHSKPGKAWKARSNTLALKISKLMFPDSRTRRKDYRKFLASARLALRVVEVPLSSKMLDQIEPAHVPARAMKQYRRKAFSCEPIRSKLNAFVKAAKAFVASDVDMDEKEEETTTTPPPEVRLKTNGIDPYELVRTCIGKPRHVDDYLRLAWRTMIKDLQLDQDLTASLARATAVVDVSDSMMSPDGIPMAAAVAMGLIVATLSTGVFRGRFITFSTVPSFQEIDVTADLDVQVGTAHHADWGGSTNLEATFVQILHRAAEHRVPPEDMPTTLFLFTDGQFNSMTGGRTPFDRIDQMYAAAGYKRPLLVYWNLNGGYQNLPAQADTPGVCMLNGFNPKLMRAIMVNPEGERQLAVEMEKLSVKERELKQRAQNMQSMTAAIHPFRLKAKTLQELVNGQVELEQTG